LLAGYLGQTAIKTQKIINESLGGVLFIDEAYALAPKGDSSNGDSFSKECIDTLCENMSVHKENWMVIIAGYENELKNTFFKTNAGLESRFLWRFYIDNYSWKELVQIYEKKVKEQGWKLDMEISKLEKFIKDNMDHFKYYGRDMESLFTYGKIAHARKQFGKFRVEALAGHLFRETQAKSIGVATGSGGLGIPTVFNVNARKGEPGVSEGTSMTRLQRYYAKATVGYN
jgi:SpoVK/Ycf46/Vps4 family AAA+-type ATPase